MRFDGVFMDMYGTITTGDRAAVEGVCAALVRDAGLACTPGELAITWGNQFFHRMETASHDGFRTLLDLETGTLVETLAALNVTLDPTDYIARLSAYWCAPPLQPEVGEVLGDFPVPICVVSNADRADVDAVLKLHALPVAHVVTSEDVRAYKPDPHIFEVALAQTGWQRDRVLHVGDSLHSDVGGAQAVGIQTAWINRVHRIHDIGNHTPDYEFDSLTGVCDLLRTL